MRWVDKNQHLQSAVVFGSMARRLNDGYTDCANRSDLDIHVVASGTKWLAAVDWEKEIEGQGFCMCASRPATGGVRKWSIIYSSAQIDLVVVPAFLMNTARVGVELGLFEYIRPLRAALNEMATCLRSGYCFIKGEAKWGSFYRIVSKFPGVRLEDAEIVELADAALCDCLWVLQKLEAGELVAAQHVLHSRVVETNLRLWRESRIRDGLPLPSFGLGRNLEFLMESGELSSLCVSSLARAGELEMATRGVLNALQGLVCRLCPEWSISPEMMKLLRSTGPSSLHP